MFGESHRTLETTEPRDSLSSVETAGGPAYALYFSYVHSWLQIRDEPNVLLLHYADAVRDRPQLVKTLAAFYDVPLDASADESRREFRFGLLPEWVETGVGREDDRWSAGTPHDTREYDRSSKSGT